MTRRPRYGSRIERYKKRDGTAAAVATVVFGCAVIVVGLFAFLTLLLFGSQ